MENKNDKLIIEVLEYLKSDELKKVKSELNKYIKTKDLSDLTMLNRKHLLTETEILKIQNGELTLSELNKKRTDDYITICGLIIDDCDIETNRTCFIDLDDFAKYTVEMIDYIEKNINNKDFELMICHDEFGQLFALPDLDCYKPSWLHQEYQSNGHYSLSAYSGLANFVITDLYNKWAWN